MTDATGHESDDPGELNEGRNENGETGSWTSERLALSALGYRIPSMANRLPDMLGGLTAILLIVLIASGLYLSQFYNPDPVGAHDSVRYIIARAPLGDWVRSLHWWATTGLVLTIVGHLVYTFLRRSYRKPREVTWWAGVGMAALIFLLIVTGGILPLDQEGIEALAHLEAGGELTGLLGGFFTNAFTLSAPLITRIYALHASVIPLLLLGLVAAHFWLIRHLGISDESTESSTFSVHLRRLLGIGLLGIAILGIVAVLAPRGLGYPGVEGIEITRPFWALRWVYGLENLLGAWGMVVGPAFLVLFLTSIPLIDRGRPGMDLAGVWLHRAGLLILLVVLVFEVYGLWGPSGQHLGM